MIESGDDMKTILIFSFSPYDWEEYGENLNPLLEGSGIGLEMSSVLQFVPPSGEVIAVLSTIHEFFYYLKEFIPESVPIIWMNHTIEKSLYRQLVEICRKQRFSIVSDSMFYSEGRKQMLINLGLPAQCIRPWYPGLGEELEQNVLLFEDVPIPERKGQNIIPVKNRGKISVVTLVELFGSIGRTDLLETQAFRDYARDVCFNVRQSNDMVDVGSYYMRLMDKSVSAGFLMFSDNGIYYCNTSGLQLLRVSEHEILTKSVYDVFPFLRPYENRIGEFGERVVVYKGVHLVFNIWITEMNRSYNGYMILTDYLAETNKELRLRRQKIGQSYAARYTFDQITGKSPVLRRCKEIARNMALSSASVLIIGPSGSGKELFAQAIHNASPRRKNPFISVNCGALVASLLESELFGYVGGAFTGASREGKAGLFELAHKGTLFLDEIGEMPLSLQVKLLRVLQEREVVRVGGHEIIAVDVRIIAATNRDLKKLVEEGKFRLDLYYRLNVLPLKLPGLDERREDIIDLFSSMKKERGLQFTLSRQARKIVEQHHYEGNVRELQNCVEYLGSLGKMEILAEDLPEYMQTGGRGGEETEAQRPEDLESEYKKRVLAAVAEINRSGLGAGRRSVCRLLREQGWNLSEMRIRNILKELEGEGKVTIEEGRKGIHIKK